MHTYKIIIAYDGTNYAGWQIQPDKMSVAQQLQDTFLEVFHKPLILYGVSRTDAGVHAWGQVATFKTDLHLHANAMMQAWQACLPADIMIRDLVPVDTSYNPHAAILHKEYRYHFFQTQPSPFVQRYGWHVRTSVDIQKLQECFQILVGTHDFRSFCTGDEHENTIRTIHTISVFWSPEYQAYAISVQGPKFLRYMIRRIVGAAIFVASKPHRSPDLLKQALAEKNPKQTLPKAPAKGLMLYEVVYTNPACQ